MANPRKDHTKSVLSFQFDQLLNKLRTKVLQFENIDMQHSNLRNPEHCTSCNSTKKKMNTFRQNRRNPKLSLFGSKSG